MSCGPIGLSKVDDSEYLCPKNSLPVAKFYNTLPTNEADENQDSCISVDEFLSYIDRSTRESFSKVNRHFFTCSPIDKYEISDYVDWAFKDTSEIIKRGFEIFINDADARGLPESLDLRVTRAHYESNIAVRKANHKFTIALIAEKGGSGIGIQTNKGGEISYLEEGSGADKSGIRLGDYVKRFNGIEIHQTIDDFAYECRIPSLLEVYRPFKFLGVDIGYPELMKTLMVPSSEYGVHFYIVDRLPFNS